MVFPDEQNFHSRQYFQHLKGIATMKVVLKLVILTIKQYIFTRNETACFQF